MYKLLFIPALLFIGLHSNAQTHLQILLIRHAEKPAKGYNLTCQGLNRSLQLPGVITKRFGIPSACYIPALGLGDTTKHARMFQTITPLAAQYNLILDSKYEENDSTGIAADILRQKGTVVVVWEHKRIVSIAHALGIKDDLLHWSDDDYDSIWVLSFDGTKTSLRKEHQNLAPSTSCPI